ncbi:MAG: hypothetical protein NPIRA02_22630 [Nitrospirales bacterium]|nr:MAG: hypothetical protein NPIRA02_22630 [Nitrospirales bacterium]
MGKIGTPDPFQLVILRGRTTGNHKFNQAGYGRMNAANQYDVVVLSGNGISVHQDDITRSY